MEKIGRVVSVDGKYAKIEVLRDSSCGDKCGSCQGGCSKTGSYIEVKNIVEAKPSQFVMIGIETKTVMKAAFYAYVFPLILLILGIVLGSYLYPMISISFPLELFSLFIGLSFMVLSYSIVRLVDLKYKEQNRIQYKILKIL